MKLCCKLVIVLSMVFSACVSAETSLYEITKGDQKIYLGGTIHVLRTSDYPLPPEFEHAYENAKILVLETDLNKANSPEFAQQMAQSFAYSGGKRLSHDLDPKIWQELKNVCAQSQFPLEQMSIFKAMFVSLSLSIMEMQRKGYGVAQGVDTFFHQKAIADKKTIQGLETTDEVLMQLTSLADMDANLIIKTTLRDIQKMDQVLARSVGYWRAGELDKLDTEMASDMRRETPEVYQQLLVARNQAWLPKVEAMFSSAETELVLVGSLHLSGDDGLLAQLEQRGYKITPYKFKK